NNLAAAARYIRARVRAEAFTEAPAQFFQNAPRALHVDLAWHLDRGVVAVVASAQGSAERVGILLGTRRPEPARPAVGAGAQHALLLHGLGEVLRAPTPAPAIAVPRKSSSAPGAAPARANHRPRAPVEGAGGGPRRRRADRSSICDINMQLHGCQQAK